VLEDPAAPGDIAQRAADPKSGQAQFEALNVSAHDRIVRRGAVAKW
jgi:hypothetical protein